LSLDTLWAETTYTHARCVGDPNATDLATTITPFLAELEETKVGQQRMWQREIEAQACCDNVNGRMDDVVVEVADNLFFVTRDRNSPRAKLYIPQTPYSIVRMALRSEVELIRSWPGSLSSEPEESLKALAPKVTDIIQKADVALAAQDQARNERLKHRVRVIVPVIDRLNNARFKLYGQLVARAEEKGLGKYWPDGFFKVAERHTTDETEEPANPSDPGSSPS
jgi:hypothetical protein